jgi:hypothetical protein
MRDSSGDWTVTDKSGETPRVTEALAVLALGALGLLFALNGRRVYRLSIGNNALDTRQEEMEQRAKPRLDNPKTIEKLDKDLGPSAAAPIVAASAGTTVIRDGKPYQVLGLYDLPPEVVGDALSHWPTDDSPPKNAAELTFALRRKGRGNHAWLLQFKDKRELWVSYGGQGKDEPTVAFD